MNDNLNTTVAPTEGGPVQLKFTDSELEQLLTNKPFDGGLTDGTSTIFFTDTDEADEEAKPTVH